MAMLFGGTGRIRQATKEVEKICAEMKEQVEEKAGKKFDEFNATSFSSQTVAGTNYFIKVHVGGEEYIHIKVFRSLPGGGYKLSLQGVQTSKKKEDTIEYF